MVKNGLHKYNIPSYDFNLEYNNEVIKKYVIHPSTIFHSYENILEKADQTIDTILNITLPIGENGMIQ